MRNKSRLRGISQLLPVSNAEKDTQFRDRYEINQTIWKYIIRHTTSVKTLRTPARTDFTSLYDTKYPHQIAQFICNNPLF